MRLRHRRLSNRVGASRACGGKEGRQVMRILGYMDVYTKACRIGFPHATFKGIWRALRATQRPLNAIFTSKRHGFVLLLAGGVATRKRLKPPRSADELVVYVKELGLSMDVLLNVLEALQLSLHRYEYEVSVGPVRGGLRVDVDKRVPCLV